MSKYALDKFPVWARIKGLLDGLTRKKELAEKVAKKVGEPPITVVVNERKLNPPSSLRARVFLNVNSPLVRFVPTTLKERKRCHVYYERLIDFCFFRGCMGHLLRNALTGFMTPVLVS